MKVGEEEIQLAPKEFDLLWELLDHRGLVLTRDQLLERVWGYTFAGDTRTVDVHVRQLRRKLGDASPIVTVWGVGYKVVAGRGAQRAATALGGLRACSARCAFACRRSSWRDRARRALVATRDRAPALPGLHARPSRSASCARRRAGSPSCTPSRRYTRSTQDEGRADVRRVQARGGDRRPPLLRRRAPLVPEASSSRPHAPAASDVGADLAHDADRSRSSSSRPAATGRTSPSRSRSLARRACVRRDRRRHAEGRAARRAG